jgi:hypothetical protein
MGTQQLADAQGVKLVTPPKPEDLDNLEQEIYQLEVNAAVSLGFPVATLSTDLKHAVLVLGVTRYKDVIGTDGHVYRFGVALRAVITVTSTEINFQLTLPTVAAKVQLGDTWASARLMVQGYRGLLGSALPSWQDFDVESYGQYIQKVSELQTKVLDETTNIVPELLGTSAVAPAAGPPGSASLAGQAASPAASLGMVYALRQIAHGRSLGQALDEFKSDDREARAAVEATYADRVGGDAGTQPQQEVKQKADADLLGYVLDHKDLLHR